MAPRWQVFFPSSVPSGLTCLPSVVAAIADDCGILCLLIWQQIFHFSASRINSWNCFPCSVLEGTRGISMWGTVPLFGIETLVQIFQKNAKEGGETSSTSLSFLPHHLSDIKSSLPWLAMRPKYAFLGWLNSIQRYILGPRIRALLVHSTKHFFNKNFLCTYARHCPKH